MKSFLDWLWFVLSLLAIGCFLGAVLWVSYLATIADHPGLIFVFAVIAAVVLYWISSFLYSQATPTKDTNLIGFDDFGFPDAYLLEIREGNDFEMDMYVYLCGHATLVFPNVKHVRWIERTMETNVDCDGSIDYGNFRWVIQRGQKNIFLVRGDFGKVEIESEYPFARRSEDFSGWNSLESMKINPPER